MRPAILRSRGYHTAAFIGSIALDPHGGAPGFDRGFDTYDAGFSTAAFDKEEDRYRTVERRGGEVVEHALAWLNSHPQGPFFMWVHLYDPHEPYEPPEPYKSRYAAEPYDGEIAYMDSAVGKLLRELKARGLYDGTMIAVMADHGESLGAHGENNHGFFLYDETIRVPLVIKLPRRERRRNGLRTGRAGGCDADAVADCGSGGAGGSAGQITGRTDEGGRGRSYRFLARPSSVCESDYPHIAFGWSALQSLRTGKYLYIQAPRRELYDQTVDPEAEHNLAATSTAVADTLGGQVREIREKTTSKRAASKLSAEKVAALDPAAQAKLASLGYVASGSHVFKSSDQEPDPKDKIGTIRAIRHVNDLMADEHYSEAIPVLQKLIAENPEMPMPYSKLGDCYLKAHEFEKAEPVFRKAVVLDPKFTDAEMGLAKTLMRLGDIEEATTVLEKVTARVPNLAEAHLLLQIAYARSNRVPETISECEKVLKFFPRSYGTYLTLGQFLAKSGDLEGAVPKLQEAAALRPEIPAPHLYLADVYTKLGKQADAERERAEAERLAANPIHPADGAPDPGNAAPQE